MTLDNNDVDVTVHESSGDIFADLGIELSDEDKLKLGIVSAISASISKRNLTQAQAGEIMRVDQAKVSALLRGRVAGFSVERLLGLLLRMGRDVDVSISKGRRGRTGRLRVKAAAA